MNRKSVVFHTLPGAGLILALCLSGIPVAQADWALVIAGSPRNFAVPAPLGYGTNSVVTNIWVTNGVDSAVTVDGTNWGCNGWTLKKTANGAAVSAGTGTQAVFQMTTNLTLTWAWTNFILTVAGNPVAVDTPVPLGYGANSNLAANAWVTNSVGGLAAVNGTNWGCIGWALKRTTGGAAVTSGTGTLAVFQMTTNLTLTWIWTNYVLTIAGNPVAVDTPVPLGYGANSNLAANTWITNGVEAALQANGTNWGSKGWTLKRTGGGAVTSGSETQAVFQMTTNLTLTWNWTNYWLAVEGNPGNYGAPAPLGYGTYSNIQVSTWITNAIDTPTNESAGTRRACIGWNLGYANGTPVANDSTAQAVFQMRADSLVLTWNWTNEYYLTTTANSNGTVNPGAAGWYTNGLLAQAAATPDPGSVFLQWTGDVPAESRTNNPVTLVMDQPRTVRAQFSANPGAELKQWTGTGNWMSWTNWSPAGLPGPEDDVLIKSGSVTLSDPVNVASLTITNSTLTFVNWLTLLTATSNVTIRKTGLVTCAGPFDDNSMSNRVWIACSNLSIESGSIDVTAKGYSAGYGQTTMGQGPGGGDTHRGGGYGGSGGNSGGSPYGSTDAPTDPGSGGGGAFNGSVSGWGGAGGGAVWIQASGAVSLAGAITANGGAKASTFGSGGSGGAILIDCNTFSGTGTLNAVGGNGASYGGVGGNGGGGRIAVNYNPAAQRLRPIPAVIFSASTGVGGDLAFGGAGSLSFPDTGFLTETIPHTGQLFIPGFTRWAPDTLMISNALIRFQPEGFLLAVTNKLTIWGTGVNQGLETIGGPVRCGGDVVVKGAFLKLYRGGGAGSQFDCGGDLMVSNGGSLYVYGVATNGTPTNYGAVIGVTGTLTVASSSWIYPYSDTTNGGSPFFRVGNLQIEANCGFYAVGLGYMGGWYSSAYPGAGPGGGRYADGGGGHGGGGGLATGGGTYGNSNAPIDSGSGGGGNNAGAKKSMGGRGGGVVRILAFRNVTVNGTISVNGTNWEGYYGGGGSGGSIYIQCNRFSGSGGRLFANGGMGLSYGPAAGGGGGGGRIAIRRNSDTARGSVLAFAYGGGNGVGGTNGVAGTIVWNTLPFSGAVIIVR